MAWFTRDQKPTTPIGDALRAHVDQATDTRSKAARGDRSAQRALDSRDLGERAANALRQQNRHPR